MLKAVVLAGDVHDGLLIISLALAAGPLHVPRSREAFLADMGLVYSSLLHVGSETYRKMRLEAWWETKSLLNLAFPFPLRSRLFVYLPLLPSPLWPLGMHPRICLSLDEPLSSSVVNQYHVGQFSDWACGPRREAHRSV